jgi:hypothetical protein
LVADEYNLEIGERIGRKNQRPYVVNGKQAVKLTTSTQTTPQYSIRLMDLFPGLFQDGTFLIPTGSLTEEVTIDLVFSKDGALDTNERAVFMPSLSTNAPNSLAQVAISTVGYTGDTSDNKQNVVLYEDGVSQNQARLLVDIVGGYTQNVRVLDGGRGFVANELLDFDTKSASLTAKLQVTAGDEAFENPTSSNNINVKTQGTGFVLGQQHEFSNTTGTVVSKFVVTASQVGMNGAH